MNKWKPIHKNIATQEKAAGKKVSLFMNNYIIDADVEGFIWDSIWGFISDIFGPIHV